MVELHVVKVFETQPEVGHENLNKIRLVNHVADVAVPFLRVICVSAVEHAEHLLRILLFEIHVYNQNNDACIEKVEQKENFDNSAHFL